MTKRSMNDGDRSFRDDLHVCLADDDHFHLLHTYRVFCAGGRSSSATNQCDARSTIQSETRSRWTRVFGLAGVEDTRDVEFRCDACQTSLLEHERNQSLQPYHRLDHDSLHRFVRRSEKDWLFIDFSHSQVVFPIRCWWFSTRTASLHSRCIASASRSSLSASQQTWARSSSSTRMFGKYFSIVSKANRIKSFPFIGLKQRQTNKRVMYKLQISTNCSGEPFADLLPRIWTTHEVTVRQAGSPIIIDLIFN